MTYYFSKKIEGKSFNDSIQYVKQALQSEGFGVLSEINIAATLKAKLDIDFKNYVILGACNPPFAHRALAIEEKIGVFLPCNVIVVETQPGVIEVSAVDAVASMMAVQNPQLTEVATAIQQKLQNVMNNL